MIGARRVHVSVSGMVIRSFSFLVSGGFKRTKRSQVGFGWPTMVTVRKAALAIGQSWSGLGRFRKRCPPQKFPRHRSPKSRESSKDALERVSVLECGGGRGKGRHRFGTGGIRLAAKTVWRLIGVNEVGRERCE